MAIIGLALIPRALKISGGAFSIVYESTGYVAAGQVSYLFAGNYVNSVVIGREIPGCASIGALFIPEEAWNIDTKMDDGKPGTGKLVTRAIGMPGGHPNCSDGTNMQGDTAQYRLDYTSAACGFYMKQ